MAPISEDVVFNVLMNAVQFAQGADTVIRGFDDMTRGLDRLQKGVSVARLAFAHFLGDLASDAFRAGVRGFKSLVSAITETEEIGSRLENLGLILKKGILGPLFDDLLKIAAGTLDKITSLFRDAEGNWTRPFYKLRTIAQTIGSWLLSLWQRLMGKLGDAGQTWLDRLINGLVAAIQKAAQLLRRLATFVARIFGGTAPGEVTEAAVARTRAAPMARPEAVPLLYEEKKAEKAKKLPKPVAPPAAEDLKQMSNLTGAWANATKRLADASKAAARARAAMAKAEDWLEAASERVYDIRRKIQRLELDWAEIPERFIRGRKRQLQIELQAAQHEEHERKKVVDAERERMQLAEQYERQAQKIADNVKRQMDTLANSIERQAQKYADYLERLREAQEEQAEAGKTVVDAFKGIEIPPGILEDIEGKLQPAFADIELSVASIADSLDIAWEKGKLWAGDLWTDLKGIKTWLEDVAARIVTMFDEIIKRVRELWAEISPTIEKIREWFPEEREAQTTRWMEAGKAIKAGDVRKEGKSQAERWAAGLQDGQPAIDKAGKSIFETFYGWFEELDLRLVKGSLVPDLVNSVVTWFDRMEIDTSAILDRLIGQVNLLDTAAQGLMPRLADLNLASGGNFKLVTVHVRDNVFGGEVTKSDVHDAIYTAINEVIR